MLRRRTLLKQTIVGDLNTKLLLHFDGSVVDASPYSVPVSAEAGTSFAAGRFVSKGIKVNARCISVSIALSAAGSISIERSLDG